MAEGKFPPKVTEEKFSHDVFEDLRETFRSLWKRSELMNEDYSTGTENKENTIEFSNMLNELKESIRKVKAKKKNLPELLEKLNIYCEKFQKIRLSRDDTSVIKDLMNFLKELFDIKIVEKDEKYKVKLFGHFLHQFKLIQHPKTREYEKVLKMFDIYWNKLVKVSYNDDRRYLNKLTGLAYHLDAIRYWKLDDVDKAFENAKSTKKFYERGSTWKDESVKLCLTQWLDDTIEQLSDVRREQECKEGKIGRDGGRLITNHCELDIPRNALDQDVNLQIHIDAKNINLPDENVQISPTLLCEPQLNLYEPATIRLPTFCTTDSEEVHANVFAMENEDEGWKNIHSGLLKDVKKDMSFKTKIVNKVVIAIKKTLFGKTAFRLHTDVWYSPQGNFVGVVYTNDKAIKELFHNDLLTRGFIPSQVVFNPIAVKGSDLLELELSCQSSKVIKFESPVSKPFTAKKDLAKHEHKHYANFRLRVLPVGDEKIIFQCSLVRNGEHVEQVEWNETWASQSGPHIEDLFRMEIVPTFRDLHIKIWEKFATDPSGLGLTDREINRQIDLANTPIKEQRLKALILWKEKSAGMGKRGRDENDNTLKDIIRKKTIAFREVSQS